MTFERETLKAWVHWKKKEVDVSEEDLLFAEEIEKVLEELVLLKKDLDGAFEKAALLIENAWEDPKYHGLEISDGIRHVCNDIRALKGTP